MEQHNTHRSRLGTAPSALQALALACLVASACSSDTTRAGLTDSDASAALTGGKKDSGANDDDTEPDEGEDAGEQTSQGDGDSIDPSRCGTRGAKACGAGEFCDFAAASQCGALDQGGTCTKKPQLCSLIYSPVCGCDNKTYSSDCNAHSAGVAVKQQGACEGGSEAGKTCGGFAGLTCGQTEFCNYEEAAGGLGCDASLADGTGVCEAKPGGCTKEYSPVCGCDGKTYSNACTAHSAGVSVKQTGECK